MRMRERARVQPAADLCSAQCSPHRVPLPTLLLHHTPFYLPSYHRAFPSSDPTSSKLLSTLLPDQPCPT